MGLEELSSEERQKLQINPETGLTSDAISIVHALFYIEPETVVEELKGSDPLPHYEDVYPAEKFPKLYEPKVLRKIVEFDKGIDKLNDLIEKAKQGEIENSPSVIETFENSVNNILATVRGKKAKPSEFMDISGRHLHKSQFKDGEDELMVA